MPNIRVSNQNINCTEKKGRNIFPGSTLHHFKHDQIFDIQLIENRTHKMISSKLWNILNYVKVCIERYTCLKTLFSFQSRFTVVNDAIKEFSILQIQTFKVNIQKNFDKVIYLWHCMSLKLLKSQNEIVPNYLYLSTALRISLFFLNIILH